MLLITSHAFCQTENGTKKAEEKVKPIIRPVPIDAKKKSAASDNLFIEGNIDITGDYKINGVPINSADGSETIINPGSNVTINGIGTMTNPYIISSTSGGSGYTFSPRPLPVGTQTIADAYPDVTLAQVQALDPGATLSNTAGWFFLQEQISKYKGSGHWVTKADNVVHIPSLNYNQWYHIDRTLNFDDIRGVQFNFPHTFIWPANGFTDYMVQIVTTDGSDTQGSVFFNGLNLRGNYTANGILWDRVHKVYFNNTQIEECRDGLTIKRVYYGGFTNGNIIRSVKSIYFAGTGDSVADEVNTIDFSNTTISAATGNSKLNYGLSASDDSYGFYINARSLGCGFYGLTIENADYGFYLNDSENSGVNLTFRATISSGYFEALGKYQFYFNPTLAVSRIDLTFSGNLINHKRNGNFPIDKFAFAQGDVIFKGNQSNVYGEEHVALEILGGVSYRKSNLVTDLLPSQIQNNTNAANFTRITYLGEKADTESYDLFTYTPTGTPVNQFNPVRNVLTNQLQDGGGFEAILPNNVSGLPTQVIHAKNAFAHSIKDIVVLNANKGFLMKDRQNGNFYRITMTNGTLATEQEELLSAVYNTAQTKHPKYFQNHNNPLENSGRFYMHGITGGKVVYNGSVWQQAGITVLGTTAQRPAAINGRVYYDTSVNDGTYFKANGTTWIQMSTAYHQPY